MIKTIGESDLAAAISLVDRVFSEFVGAAYSDEGIKTFYEFLNDPELLLKVKMWGYYSQGELWGVIATKEVSHIALMYVDKSRHGRGVAKELMKAAVKDTKASSDATAITVNASDYGLDFYRRMGFIDTGERREKNGIIFTPMAKSI